MERYDILTIWNRAGDKLMNDRDGCMSTGLIIAICVIIIGAILGAAAGMWGVLVVGIILILLLMALG
jgi:hypothetical protein